MDVSWITRSLSPQIAQSTIYIDNAKKNHRMRERNVTYFFTKLRILWDELDMLSPTPGEIYGTIKLQILMMKPLPPINKAYAQGQLEGVGNDNSKILFNSSNQQSNQGKRKPQGQGKGNFGRGRGNGNSSRGIGIHYTSKQCTYCNKFGHTVDQCYSKV
ncbi:hypothetical protein CR513_47904, partial [Mucuna pruriens]